jgi:polyhydroxybutyrate depolymerase
VKRTSLSLSLTILIFSLAILGMNTTSAAQATAPQTELHPFAHNGYSRPYLVYRPAHLSSNPPVVFMLGGTGSSAKSASEEFGWTDEADRNGFLVVFPEPLPRQPDQPFDRHTNLTFWEMQGSRSHIPPQGKLPVDDDGYLMAVLQDLITNIHADRKRIFFAGFSSGSGMVQLLAARHPESITAIASVATPLMEPPLKLARAVPVLYIHGDDDEQFSGFEVNSPDFATTPHGNWVTWGYLDGCNLQRAAKTDWGVQFSWHGCRDNVQVIGDFIQGLGHEWLVGDSSPWNEKHRPKDPLNFTDMAWRFFASVPSK